MARPRTSCVRPWVAASLIASLLGPAAPVPAFAMRAEPPAQSGAEKELARTLGRSTTSRLNTVAAAGAEEAGEGPFVYDDPASAVRYVDGLLTHTSPVAPNVTTVNINGTPFSGPEIDEAFVRAQLARDPAGPVTVHWPGRDTVYLTTAAGAEESAADDLTIQKLDEPRRDPLFPHFDEIPWVRAYDVGARAVVTIPRRTPPGHDTIVTVYCDAVTPDLQRLNGQTWDTVTLTVHPYSSGRISARPAVAIRAPGTKVIPGMPNLIKLPEDLRHVNYTPDLLYAIAVNRGLASQNLTVVSVAPRGAPGDRNFHLYASEVTPQTAGAEERRSVLYPPGGRKLIIGPVDLVGLPPQTIPTGIAVSGSPLAPLEVQTVQVPATEAMGALGNAIAEYAAVAKQITLVVAAGSQLSDEAYEYLHGVAQQHGVALTLVQWENVDRASAGYVEFVYLLDWHYLRRDLLTTRSKAYRFNSPHRIQGRILASDSVEPQAIEVDAQDRMAAKAMWSVSNIPVLDGATLVELATDEPHLVAFLTEVIKEHGTIGNPQALEPLEHLQAAIEEARQHAKSTGALPDNLEQLATSVSTSVAQLKAAAGAEEMREYDSQGTFFAALREDGAYPSAQIDGIQAELAGLGDVRVMDIQDFRTGSFGCVVFYDPRDGQAFKFQVDEAVDSWAVLLSTTSGSARMHVEPYPDESTPLMASPAIGIRPSAAQPLSRLTTFLTDDPALIARLPAGVAYRLATRHELIGQGIPIAAILPYVDKSGQQRCAIFV